MARFITLEGGEGAGKSTQASRLVGRLRAAGCQALGTREPGGSPKAEAIRAILLAGGAARFGTSAEAVLFAAARLDHVGSVIRPALSRGIWVVCDRFIDSTRAYQGAAGHVDATLVAALEAVAVGPTRPDLTLIFDLPEEMGLARARARRGHAVAADRFEQLEQAFHGKLRQSFLATAAAEPERCLVIDGSGDVESVAAAVWSAVERRLAPGGSGTGAA